MIRFAITWDYRCPFARNAHEHVLDGLAAGASWDVTFVGFSLSQVHVAEGQSDIWDRPDDDSGLLALQAGVTVRDLVPDRFPEVHRRLFAVQHDEGRNLRDEQEIRRVLKAADVAPDPIFERIADGSALARVRDDHTRAASDNNVWGVPTFIAHGSAAFVRLMDRPKGDADHAQRTINRVLDLLIDVPELNEFKHTTVTR